MSGSNNSSRARSTAAPVRPVPDAHSIAAAFGRAASIASTASNASPSKRRSTLDQLNSTLDGTGWLTSPHKSLSLRTASSASVGSRRVSRTRANSRTRAQRRACARTHTQILSESGRINHSLAFAPFVYVCSPALLFILQRALGPGADPSMMLALSQEAPSPLGDPVAEMIVEEVDSNTSDSDESADDQPAEGIDQPAGGEDDQQNDQNMEEIANEDDQHTAAAALAAAADQAAQDAAAAQADKIKSTRTSKIRARARARARAHTRAHTRARECAHEHALVCTRIVSLSLSLNLSELV